MVMNSFIPWTLKSTAFPEPGKPVYILYEEDVVDPEVHPTVRRAVLEERSPFAGQSLYWRLLDFDPETEEEILQQYFTVIAWRYVV